jgi:hypothetical protein
LTLWRSTGEPAIFIRIGQVHDLLLTYLKTYSLQVVQGHLFGMGQSKANQWIHVLLPVLLAALHSLGDAPARSLTALAQRLGVAEADAATMATPLEAEPTSIPVPASPLVPMTGRRIVRPQDPAEQQESYSGKKRDQALVGFQGRGFAEVVQPHCCYPFLLEALLFQWP